MLRGAVEEAGGYRGLTDQVAADEPDLARAPHFPCLLLDLDAPQDPLRLVHGHFYQIVLEVDPQAARFKRPSDSPILGRLHEVLQARPTGTAGSLAPCSSVSRAWRMNTIRSPSD